MGICCARQTEKHGLESLFHDAIRDLENKEVALSPKEIIRPYIPDPLQYDDELYIKLSALSYFTYHYFVFILENFINEPPRAFSDILKRAKHYVDTEAGKDWYEREKDDESSSDSDDETLPVVQKSSARGADGENAKIGPNALNEISGKKVFFRSKTGDYDVFQTNNNTDCHCYIVHDKGKNEVYVIVRPTGSLRNWIGNIHAVQVPFGSAEYPETKRSGEMKAHSGFFKRYDSIKDQVIACLLKLMPERATKPRTKVKRLVWCGMSMGAAVVQQLACYCLSQFNKRLHRFYETSFVTTFGSPRVGNREFAEALSSLVTVRNIFSSRDPVPCLPWKISGYMHAGTRLHWNPEGRHEEMEPKTLAGHLRQSLKNPMAHANYLGVDFMFWPK